MENVLVIGKEWWKWILVGAVLPFILAAAAAVVEPVVRDQEPPVQQQGKPVEPEMVFILSLIHI